MSFIDDLKDKANAYLDSVAIGRLQSKVNLILRECEELKGWSDKDLRLSTLAFRDDLKKGASLDVLLLSAFAVACEAARRVQKKMPFPVQILGGIVLHQGKIAEMKAGEGKTLTEVMPVYLNALEGKGVHVITTNDYLAQRDAELNRELYAFLGLTTGYVTSEMNNDEHRKAYACDITYVSNQEIGFDYLRDNLVFSRSERVLRQDHPLHFGIVDEIDSILIDESRTPLIIAEPKKEERNFYELFTGIVSKLKEDRDYIVDYKSKQVSMTDAGLDCVEKMLGDAIFSKDNPMYVFYLDVCLRAKTLFEKDRDYIITDNGVEIVDEFTGRVLPGRRFTDGVHQAIEAKEKVKVKDADRTMAAITFQNFFPMYEKLAGMSGTVMRARQEFNQVYKLDVAQIPTNRPIIRVDHNDLFFKTAKGKFEGLVKKVRYIHKKGQPLLIGTRNVETAHTVATLLDEENLPYQLLTAADHRAEAEKIAKAGQEDMITIATNMAGRGTDILLGNGVEALGGLYVLGTERHESRRIDDQLIGRSGRQGEPGESQFLISMEDEIMQLFGSEKIIDVMEQFDIPEDEYISGKGLTDAFKRAQDFVESKNYDSRIYLYKYDSVTNFQRESVYELRDKLLENPTEFDKFLKESVKEVVAHAFGLGDAKLISQEMINVFGLDVGPEELEELEELKPSDRKKRQRKLLNEWLNPFYHGAGATGDQVQSLAQATERSAQYIASLAMRIKDLPDVYEAAQGLILEILDNQWSAQLELMEALKEESGLLSYASEDPLIEFILEARNLFEHMHLEVKRQFLKMVFQQLRQRGKLE